MEFSVLPFSWSPMDKFKSCHTFFIECSVSRLDLFVLKHFLDLVQMYFIELYFIEQFIELHIELQWCSSIWNCIHTHFCNVKHFSVKQDVQRKKKNHNIIHQILIELWKYPFHARIESDLKSGLLKPCLKSYTYCKWSHWKGCFRGGASFDERLFIKA